MQDERPFSLTPDFAPVTEQAWRQAVDKDLKGASFEKRLVTQTPEGVALRPLYHADNTQLPAQGPGLPGAWPYTRGAQALRQPQGHWQIRQPCALHQPAQANAAMLRDLERGADGVLLESSSALSGGAALRDLEDLDTAFQGIWMQEVPLALDAGPDGLAAAGLWLALARRRGVEPAALRGDLLLDPVGALASHGSLPCSAQQGLAQGARVAAWCLEHAPGLRALSVDTAPYDSAGASLSWSLALALSSGVAWLRALEGAGVSLEQGASQILFRLRIGPRHFMDIAALRAARLLWARVTQACGVQGAPMTLEARLGRRYLTRRDPWVNMLRGTAACFAGAIGGADVVVVDAFDEALGGGQALGRRVARNTQIILQREAHLAQIEDPAGGSWFLETLTAELAQAAWGRFQQLEAQGGVLAALEQGFVHRALEEDWQRRKRDLDRRKAPITGVSEFPLLSEALPAAAARQPVAPRELAQPSAAQLAPLREAAAGQGDLVEALIQAATEGVPLHALREALAVSCQPQVIQALPHRGEAQGFEALRDRSDLYLGRRGQRPQAFLALLGPLPEHNARASFARNLLQAGGVEPVDEGPCADPQAAAEALARRGCAVAVICGADARYQEEAAAVAAALRAAGARHIVLAGRPGDMEESLRQAGVSDFVYLGCDALAALEALWSALEVKA